MHLERRRRQVLSELETHPEQRVAVNVVDAPLQPEPGVPVSVVIACRTTIGIVSAEMHIPREQLNVALFFQTLEGYSAEAAERGRLGLR